MNNKMQILMDLEPGTYSWCSCGKTKTEPLCDGSHQGTDKTPVEFTITAKKKAGICNCKRTKKAPYCDGTHARVD